MPWTILQPHYTDAGVFVDPCLWCGKDRCVVSHNLAKKNYRLSLLQKAIELIRPKEKKKRGQPKEATRESGILLDRIDITPEILSTLSPEQMGMEEQRLKKHFRELLKTMPLKEAWVLAKIETKKDAKRKGIYIPKFTREESRNIRRYKPHSFQEPFNTSIQ